MLINPDSGYRDRNLFVNRTVEPWPAIYKKSWEKGRVMTFHTGSFAITLGSYMFNSFPHAPVFCLYGYSNRLKEFRIHKRHDQFGHFTIGIKPPVSAVNAVAHTACEHDDMVPCPGQLPAKEAAALILYMGEFSAAFFKSAAK